MWIFNVYLQQDGWDGQTRRLEPAADGFGEGGGYKTVYPEDALSVHTAPGLTKQ